MVDGVDTFPPDFDFFLSECSRYANILRSALVLHTVTMVVFSGVPAGVGNCIGWTIRWVSGFPGLPKESSYSVRMFAIAFIGLSAEPTGSFQWHDMWSFCEARKGQS